MADDREKLIKCRGTELPPAPSDELVARVARALGAPVFTWSDTADSDGEKSDEVRQAEVE